MFYQEKKCAYAVKLALAVLSGSMMMSAQAQTVAGDPAEKIQKIEVTGSHIKRTDKEGTSPIQTLTAKDINQSGATTVAELLRTIPALGTGGAFDAVDGGFSRGAATASLRGLGSSSTLILLNGRRMTPSAYANPNQGQSTLYDINSIPLSMLERVEIFKDGASAVYGSDAIAGVINFITKSDFQGLQMNASMGANDNNQFKKKSVSGFGGFGNYAQDGYNITVSAEVSKRDRVAIKDANDVEKDLYTVLNSRLSAYSSFISNQPFFYRERSPGSKTFFSANDANVVNRTNCDPSHLVTGSDQYNILPTSALYGRQFCNYNTNDYNEVQGAGQDVNLMSRGIYQINDTLSAFAELAYNKSDRDYTAASRTIDGRTPATAFALSGAGTSFQAILPVGHPDNPFPKDRAAVAYRFEDIPGGSSTTNESTRFASGLKGSFKTWDWETGLLWNRSERKDTSNGFLLVPEIQKLISQNMSLAEVAKQPNLSRQLKSVGVAEIAQADFKASTEFGNLAGGAIGFASGFEFRQEKMTLTPDNLTSSGQVLGLANQFINGQRNVSSAFFEVRTPFLKNFEMDFAGRVDKYPSFKTNFVPKVGAKWTVNDSLAFRSTYAQGFRAPALVQVTAGGTQTFLSNLADPIRCPDGKVPLTGADNTDCTRSISTLIQQNAKLKPETSRSFSLGMILSPTRDFDILVDYYNIRKEDEVAALSSTLILNNPDLYPGTVIRDTNPVNFVKDKNGNVVPNSGPLISLLRNYVNQGSTVVSGLDIELAMRNNLGASGKLDTRLSTSYTIEYRRAEKPGDPETNLVGTRGSVSNFSTSVADIPRLRATLSSAWTKEAHTVNGAINFVGGVSLMRYTNAAETYPVSYCHYGSGQPASAVSLGGVAKYLTYVPDCAVASWTTVDLGYTYKGFKDVTLGFKVLNAFDSKAPYDPSSSYTTAGYNDSLHNAYGRAFSLNLGYVFK
ncbi:TonB-dependent receptor plug domain-containing protein [Undibacterium sp. Di27W]|uniref:TonB-dependent receptor plug domain-containing protein n=1 Tax=Undibacterium sp. Di27W TaxID=3413036 RepID=UPI003BF013B0